MLCSDNALATYTISDLTLEYEAIINVGYTEKVSRVQQISSYPYIRVTHLSYRQLSKKDTSWLIDTKLQAKSLQGLLLLLLENKTDFDNKVESSYNPTIKKVKVTVPGNLHEIFKGPVLPRNMYPEISRKFYPSNFDVLFEKYLTKKYGVWFDIRSSADDKLHGSGRVVNSGVKL